MFPALAGGVLTTVPPGKPHSGFLRQHSSFSKETQFALEASADQERPPHMMETADCGCYCICKYLPATHRCLMDSLGAAARPPDTAVTSALPRLAQNPGRRVDLGGLGRCAEQMQINSPDLRVFCTWDFMSRTEIPRTSREPITRAHEAPHVVPTAQHSDQQGPDIG